MSRRDINEMIRNGWMLVREPMSERIQILTYPFIKRVLVARAKYKGISVNKLINHYLEQGLENDND